MIARLLAQITTLFVVGTIFLLTGPSSLVANDSAIGGSGANVFVGEKSEVALEREYLSFHIEPGDMGIHCRVQATLVFYNPTDEDISHELAFPIGYEEENDPYKEFHNFLGGKLSVADFEVSVNGEKTPTRLEKQVKDGLAPGAEGSFSWVFLFPARFTAKSHTVIQHTYRFAASQIGAPHSTATIPYVFRTGASWAGKIEEAVFDYRFPQGGLPPNVKVTYEDFGYFSGENLLSASDVAGETRTLQTPEGETIHYGAYSVGGPVSRIRLTFYNIEPQQDVTLSFPSGYFRNWPGMGPNSPGFEECDYRLGMFLRGMKLPAEKTKKWKIDPETLVKCVAPSDLINLIYASHGYAFKSAELQKFFYQSGMFFPSATPFEEGWLNRNEVQAIEALRALEKKRKKGE